MKFSDLKLKWKIVLVLGLLLVPTTVSGLAYVFNSAKNLEVYTALSGLMNFVDAKQQGVIRFLGQNEKLARQLAVLVKNVSPEAVQQQFRAIVEIDTFNIKEHPFQKEIEEGRRRIPVWGVYHAIDFVRGGIIEISSDPARVGRKMKTIPDIQPGYSDVYLEGDAPIFSFGAKSGNGMVYVHVNAGMLTIITNGEIGNLEGDMGAYYLAGVGKTFDYYIVNRDNVMITESRVYPNSLLQRKGSKFPWMMTMDKADELGIIRLPDGTYKTNAGHFTGQREAMGFYTGHNGMEMLGVSMPFYDSEWTIVVEQEAAELLAPLYTLTFNMALLASAVLGVILWAGVYLATTISRPLTAIVGDVSRLKDGDTEIAIHEKDRKDEIGELAKAIEVFRENIIDRKQAEHVLRKLVEGTSAATGMDFFHNLVQHLAEGLGVDYAFVGELPSDAPGHVRTTAVWAKGATGENIEYDLPGTPCEHVVGKEMCCHTKHVQQLFPTDHLLVEMGVEAYAGAPIFARDGTALGLLVVLNGKPMQNTELVKSMLTIFSARAGAELERKQAEAQLIQSSKLATLGEMATGIAHELNQPLNITHMVAETLLEMANDGDVSAEVLTGKLERILSQTDRASAIINHMRMFGRTDSDELKEVDVNKAVQGAIEMVKEQLRLSEIGLSVNLPESCRPVMGQQLQLEQVILNLLTNARDAIKAYATDDNKSRRITMSIIDDPKSEEVRLTVQDTGGGIPDGVLDRIFEPFFTTKEVGQGTGLGLSISFGIIAEMGGRIEVANVDEGARLTITLPTASERSQQVSL